MAKLSIAIKTNDASHEEHSHTAIHIVCKSLRWRQVQ